jgi:iron complex outermembrane recepter protein
MTFFGHQNLLMKHVLSIIVIVLTAATTFSQTGSINVRISNDQKTPLENVTVELLRNKDSALVKAAITDASGKTVFEEMRYGVYRVKASMVNHAVYYSETLTLSAETPLLKLDNVVLQQTSKEIQGVTVEAKKPFVQRLTDRLVVNVENSIVSVGSSAMDVLERSPGVRVGQNDAISLAGKGGVIIMINGKPVPMTGEELGNYLRSLPASIIERIDLITNPPARYDAAGNAGIIDIRMKKDQRLGANGTLTGSYGQGHYPKINSGATFNYRSKKLNIFGSANYGYALHFNDLRTHRDFFQNNLFTGAYEQRNMIKRQTNSSIARLGADYFVNKKTIIGFIVTGSKYLTDRSSNNTSLVADQDNKHVSSFLTGAKGDENFKNFVTNFNLKHTFDSAGRELTADFDVAGYYRDWASHFSTGYYDATGMLSQPLYLVRNDQDGFTGIKTLKLDYVNPLRKGGKWEAGIKTSFVRSENDVLFFDRTSGIEQLDSSQSNSFNYKENINAAYVNISKEFKKLSVQLGLRAEQTNIMTYQVFDNVRMDSSYLELFPSVFVHYKLTENNTIGLSMSRRIDRPGYGQLNPFRIFVDPSFYASGDPKLKPAFTWSYELSYTRKQLNITLAYSHTNNPITTVLMPSETQSRVTIQTPINLGSFDYYGVNFNAPLIIAKWWNVINNGNIYIRHNKGYIAQTVIDKTTLNAQFSTNHSFTAGKGWGGEVNFTFDTGNNTVVMKDQFYWILGAGIQKSLWHKKGTLRLNVTDILYKQWPRFTGRYTNYHEFLTAQRDTRVVNLGLNYRFGKNTVAQSRRRTTGSEEERRRAGN